MKRPWRFRRWSLTPIVVALVAAAVGAGCGQVTPAPSRSPVPVPSGSPAPPPTSTGPAEVPSERPSRSPEASAKVDGRLQGLLLLSGRAGAMRLESIGGRGGRRWIPLPDAGVAWLSTSLDGRALATTLDGRAFVSGPLVDDALPGWQPVPAGAIDPGALSGPLAFGALAPDGSRAAFIAADFGGGGPFDLVLLPVPPSTGGSPPADASRTAQPETTGSAADGPSVIHIARPPEGAQPSWFGERVVVLARTPEDQVGTVMIDPAAPGRIAEAADGSKAGPIAGLSIAADGGRLVVASASDGRIEVHPAAAWLTGSPTTPTPVELEPEPDGSRSVAWLALAPDGERLAIVRTDAEGASVAVTVHEGADGWRQGRRIGLPAGADRAVVAWLP